MDTIILGLLMIQKFTIYELRKQIEMSYNSISSNSMGSIQAAIKKLLANDRITFHEHVENSVNKKVYEITDEGKKCFYANIAKPMRYKEKNIELYKFFNLGFLEKGMQIQQIDNYIAELREEAAGLEAIKNAIAHEEFDEHYLQRLRSAGASEDITEPHNGRSAFENMREIARFQLATLDLSMKKIAFEINWFEEFRKSLVDEKGITND